MSNYAAHGNFLSRELIRRHKAAGTLTPATALVEEVRENAFTVTLCARCPDWKGYEGPAWKGRERFARHCETKKHQAAA